MDSKTNRRLRTTRRAMAALHRGDDLRDLLPLADVASVVVALPDDTIGHVVAAIYNRPESTVKVIMELDRKRFSVLALEKDTDLQPTVTGEEPCPVSVDSSFEMLIDIDNKWKPSYCLSVNAAPGMSFDELGMFAQLPNRFVRVSTVSKIQEAGFSLRPNGGRGQCQLFLERGESVPATWYELWKLHQAFAELRQNPARK